MSTPKTKSHSTPHRPSQGNRDFRNRTKRNEKQPDGQKNTPRGAPQPHTGVATAQPGIILHAGREKSLLLPVHSAQGEFLAWAAYNSGSQITARVWSWLEPEKIDADFFRKKVTCALAARKDLKLAQHSNGMRLIHAESDGLPGLIVDQYGDVLVMKPDQPTGAVMIAAAVM